MAEGLGSVTDMVIRGIFPWCFIPELYTDARWLKSHGADGTLSQLRARAFSARLNGLPLQTLLPPPAPARPLTAPALTAPALTAREVAARAQAIRVTDPAAACRPSRPRPAGR